MQKRIVRPEALRSQIRSMHFFWKRASPTARASSRMTMSGSTAVATAKASRIAIPEE